MNQVTVRKALTEDLEMLYQFEQGVIYAERPLDPTMKEGKIHYYDIPEMIRAPHIELAIAEIDKTPVGCGYARIEEAKHYLKHPQHAYLGFMYVDPGWRGKGINNLVLDYLQNWARLKGITELRLEVYFENKTAIKAYEKAGFEKYMIEMRKKVPLP